MSVTLVIQSGDLVGRRFDVAKGKELRVGRDAPCEVRLPNDSSLSKIHFAITYDGIVARLRDCGSKFGTMHQGGKITECELKDGDRLRAGTTDFGVLITESEAAPVPNASAAPIPPPVQSTPKTSTNGTTSAPASSRPRDLLAFFQSIPNLYAILDAARELTIPQRLAVSNSEHQSLYEVLDDSENEAISFGPWLVRLPPDSPLLPSLVSDGWGDSWGVYLNSEAPFKELRHHLRRYLTVMLPDQKRVLFRYYDPRVLRAYLPTCNQDEWSSFLGPIKGYYCEDEQPDHVWLYTPTKNEIGRLAVARA